ncbi:MAG: DUF4177 domain-containing protein [Anaerolineaceae bacterium]|nr:DUF4177 domain-containing protein [Anaerolineaceae bacterium]
MARFEYMMVQVPPTIPKSKGASGSEAASYLQSIVNEHATKGWEFYRVDSIGVVSDPGCLGALLGQKQTIIEYYVVTFRKQQGG